MDTIHKPAFLPDLAVILEEMTAGGWACQGQIRGSQRFRGVRIYRGQMPDPGLLYVLDPGQAEGFPTDRFCYVSAGVVPGQADHICCVEHPAEEIQERIQQVLESFQDQQARLDDLLTSGRGLGALCALGEELLGNPVFIHDDWFVVIAKSRATASLLPGESYNGSALEYLPKAWLEEFKFDQEYQQTYQETEPCIWQGDGGRSLYVNLTENGTYRGRLLAVELLRPFRARDFQLMERLRLCAMVIMQCRQRNPYSKLRSMDRMVIQLLEGNPIPSSDEANFLSVLSWREDDPLLCIRLESQQRDDTALLERTLHSTLFEKLSNSYILYRVDQQAVIVNLRLNPMSISAISHILSPLCRDYFHYAGISNPVRGLQELGIAYEQAGVALEQAFQARDANWVQPFSACALEYLLTKLKPPVALRHVIAPQLMRLLMLDEEKSTEYFRTLRVFLVRERDIPRTSQELIIHRTTLLYRLKKIQSLTGVSLDDSQTRLYLLLSFKMMELEKLIPPLPEIAQ